MDWQAIMHWAYVAAMAIGALHFWALSRKPQGVPQHEYLVAIFIPIWSGLAYMAMAIGQGKTEIAGLVVHYARYIDWIVTTPLLLLSISWTAMQFIKKDWTLIGFLMGTQVIVIASGLIADLSERDWVRYLWYLCGVAAFLVVLWGVWGPLRAKSKSQGPELSDFHDKLTVYFTGLWISYPLVWIIGPSGFGWIDQNLNTLLFCILPFFSKVGFSFLDLHGLRNLRGRHSETPADRAADRMLCVLGWISSPWASKRSTVRRGSRRISNEL